VFILIDWLEQTDQVYPLFCPGEVLYAGIGLKAEELALNILGQPSDGRTTVNEASKPF
jgi:hypothetical protein